jgi:hypothetical protein
VDFLLCRNRSRGRDKSNLLTGPSWVFNNLKCPFDFKIKVTRSSQSSKPTDSHNRWLRRNKIFKNHKKYKKNRNHNVKAV